LGGERALDRLGKGIRVLQKASTTRKKLHEGETAKVRGENPMSLVFMKEGGPTGKN